MTTSQGIQPITKNQVKEDIEQRVFPDFVIKAFNECISESQLKKSSKVLQKDVVARIVKLGSVEKQEIFANHWLDVENHYRRAGWTVLFDKPGFNESYEAYFIFE